MVAPHLLALCFPPHSLQMCWYLQSDAFDLQIPLFCWSHGSSLQKSDLVLALPGSPAPMGLSQYSCRSSNWTWSMSSKSRCSPTQTQIALSRLMILKWLPGLVAEKSLRICYEYMDSLLSLCGKAKETALEYWFHVMNQLPKVLTCLEAFTMPNLNWMSPTTSTSLLSLEMAKLPDMTWSRLTIDPMMMMDHLKLGNCGANREVRMEDFANSSESIGLVNISWMVHGKSFSSTFCLLETSRYSVGETAHFSPVPATYAVSDRSTLLDQAVAKDHSCYSKIWRYVSSELLSSELVSRGGELADDRMSVISLMAPTLSMAVHLPFQNFNTASRHFMPIWEKDSKKGSCLVVRVSFLVPFLVIEVWWEVWQI